MNHDHTPMNRPQRGAAFAGACMAIGRVSSIGLRLAEGGLGALHGPAAATPPGCSQPAGSRRVVR